ncbi:MAG: type II toxin-antitoxin system VapC family toxin [Ramlibacter sp.]|uniref:type II toxin-antitoxin system VapC family toxin n=1 Tax=Ramlibacter sp. TaxID=1917967 RepID=UPI0026106891|nr:type II toxin-antitoxin system VapC family toxin [Ramlibacter sp.]MDH4375059.1 type II toxin-antitoxin system VapC family toxin [Ramlibacter sp.]
MRVLFDTSALLKRYLPEPGREAMLAWFARARPVVTAPHCRVELYSALNRVRRDARTSEEAYRKTCDEVERNFDAFDVVPWTTVMERAAIRALEASPLRAGDALHIAAAVAAGVDHFITADQRQYQGALAVGLKATLLDN